MINIWVLYIYNTTEKSEKIYPTEITVIKMIFLPVPSVVTLLL